MPVPIELGRFFSDNLEEKRTDKINKPRHRSGKKESRKKQVGAEAADRDGDATLPARPGQADTCPRICSSQLPPKT